MRFVVYSVRMFFSEAGPCAPMHHQFEGPIHGEHNIVLGVPCSVAASLFSSYFHVLQSTNKTSFGWLICGDGEQALIEFE